jgi:hypothetical protein
MVLLPALPVAALYSQVPFCGWKLAAYLLLAYVIAFIFSYKIHIQSHKLHALGVLITLVFIGTVITIIQDFYMVFPPNENIWELVGLSFLFLAAAMVVFAVIFWLYWKMDVWICKKLAAH